MTPRSTRRAENRPVLRSRRRGKGGNKKSRLAKAQRQTKKPLRREAGKAEMECEDKKSPRRKAGDFLMCYVNYPVCASVFDESQKLAAIRIPP